MQPINGGEGRVPDADSIGLDSALGLDVVVVHDGLVIGRYRTLGGEVAAVPERAGGVDAWRGRVCVTALGDEEAGERT